MEWTKFAFNSHFMHISSASEKFANAVIAILRPRSFYVHLLHLQLYCWQIWWTSWIMPCVQSYFLSFITIINCRGIVLHNTLYTYYRHNHPHEEAGLYKPVRGSSSLNTYFHRLFLPCSPVFCPWRFICSFPLVIYVIFSFKRVFLALSLCLL